MYYRITARHSGPHRIRVTDIAMNFREVRMLPDSVQWPRPVDIQVKHANRVPGIQEAWNKHGADVPGAAGN